MKSDQIAKIAFWVTLAGLSLASVYVLLRPLWQVEAPRVEDWLEAASFIKANLRQGDIIRVEPIWMTEGRVYFSDLDGGARQALRLLDVHDKPDPIYLYKHKRLWVVAAVEMQERIDVLGLENFGLELELEKRFAKLVVRRYRIPQGKLLLDVKDDMQILAVSRVYKNGRVVKCKCRKDVCTCPKPAKYSIRRQLREVADGPRYCIVAEPDRDGSCVEIRFSTRLADTVVVRAGNTVEAARSKKGGDCILKVWVNRQLCGELTIEKNSYRWDEVEVDTSQYSGTEGSIRIEICAEKAGKRQVCFDAAILKK